MGKKCLLEVHAFIKKVFLSADQRVFFMWNNSSTLLKFFHIKLKHQPYSYVSFVETVKFHILIYK